MRILDRYIARHVNGSCLLVLLVLLGLFAFFDVIDRLEDVGKGNFGLLALFKYVALRLPHKIYEVFPITLLLGGLIGLSVMAMNSELTAARAAGIGVWRIILSVWRVALLWV